MLRKSCKVYGEGFKKIGHRGDRIEHMLLTTAFELKFQTHNIFANLHWNDGLGKHQIAKLFV